MKRNEKITFLIACALLVGGIAFTMALPLPQNNLSLSQNNIDKTAWQTAKIQFEGNEITFPCEYSEVDDHFTIENISAFPMIEANDYERDFSYLTTKSGAQNLCKSLRVELYNPSNEAVKAKGTYIYYFSAYVDDDATTPLPDIVFPNGVTFNMTYDDIVALYGEPTETTRQRVSYITDRVKLSITFDGDGEYPTGSDTAKWFEYEIDVEKYDWR